MAMLSIWNKMHQTIKRESVPTPTSTFPVEETDSGCFHLQLKVHIRSRLKWSTGSIKHRKMMFSSQTGGSVCCR